MLDIIKKHLNDKMSIEEKTHLVRQIDSHATMVTEQNFKEFLKTQLAKIDFSFEKQ